MPYNTIKHYRVGKKYEVIKKEKSRYFLQTFYDLNFFLNLF